VTAVILSVQVIPFLDIPDQNDLVRGLNESLQGKRFINRKYAAAHNRQLASWIAKRIVLAPGTRGQHQEKQQGREKFHDKPLLADHSDLVLQSFKHQSGVSAAKTEAVGHDCVQFCVILALPDNRYTFYFRIKVVDVG